MNKIVEKVKEMHPDNKYTEFDDGTWIIFFNEYSQHISNSKQGYHYSADNGNYTKFLANEKKALEFLEKVGKTRPKCNVNFSKIINKSYGYR